MRFVLPAVAVVCVLVLFSGLEGVGWTDAREARDATVAREMIRHREPITPLYAAEPLFEKPALAYGVEIAARVWPGPWAARTSPLRSRVVRAIAAVLLVLLAGALAAARFGRRAGVWSALALVSTLGVAFASRVDGTQLFATLLGWSAIALFARPVTGDLRGAAWRTLAGFSALAAALVIAGPWPALWPVAGVALYAAAARDRGAWSRLRAVPGLLFMIGVALPWYGAAVDRNGPRVLASAWSFPYGAESPGSWFMAPLLALSFLVVAFYPWSALLPDALRHAATFWRTGARNATARALPAGAPETRHRDPHEEREAHWMVANLLAALVPVAIHPGVPLTAVLPALPAAAILCGRFADHAFEDAERLRRPITHAARMLALVGTLGSLLLMFTSRRVPEAAADVRLLAAATFVTAWLPVLAAWRDRLRWALALFAIPVAVGAPIVTLLVLPSLESYVSARMIAVTINEHTPPLAPLAMFEPAPASLRVTLRRNLVTTSPDAAHLRALCASDGFTYLAFSPRTESDVARRLAIPLEIVMRSPSLVLARVNPAVPPRLAPTVHKP